MDWNMIASPRFGEESQGKPTLTRSRVDRRWAMMVAHAAEVRLPAPGEAVHGVITGMYDLAALLVAALAQKDAVCTHLRIATLSYSERNIVRLCQLLDDGKVGTVSVLCSTFFRNHNKTLFSTNQADLRKRRSRISAARNHCKVVCLDFADGTRYTLEGSANLRRTSDWEQFCLCADAQLHDWHAHWIDDLVTKHEAD